MLRDTNHKENTNQNHNEIPPQNYESVYDQQPFQLTANASTQPENVSTSTGKCLKLPGTLGMTVQLICQPSLGMSLDILNGLIWGFLGGRGLVLGCSLYTWHVSQLSD